MSWASGKSGGRYVLSAVCVCRPPRSPRVPSLWGWHGRGWARCRSSDGVRLVPASTHTLCADDIALQGQSMRVGESHVHSLSARH